MPTTLDATSPPSRMPPSAPVRARSIAAIASFLLVATATLTVNFNTLGNGFVMDDGEIVTENPLNRSLSNVWKVATSMDALRPSDPLPYYRPLNRLTYLLDFQLFGLDPWGYHLTNVLVHLAATLLSLALAHRLLGAWVPATLSSLLFAVHPIHSEAVNWISARNNLLATACVLAGSLAFLRRDRVRSWSVSGWYLAGALAKETGAMLLPHLALFEWTTDRSPHGIRRDRWRAIGWMAAGAAVYVALRTAILPPGARPRVSVTSLGQSLTNVAYAVPKYLINLAFPAHLTIQYRPPVEYFPSHWLVAIAWAAIAIFVVVLWRQGRPGTRFGILWAVLFYLPASSIVPFPAPAVADRFAYTPAIGVWLILCDQLTLGLERTRRARVLVPMVAVLLVVLGVGTVRRNGEWKDMPSLLEAAVRSDPDFAGLQFELGLAYLNAGQGDRARAQWERTLELEPRHLASLELLGTHHLERGALDDAERTYERILAFSPEHADSHFNLALIMEKTGRPVGALEHYRRFLAFDAGRRPALEERVRARVAELGRGLPQGPTSP